MPSRTLPNAKRPTRRRTRSRRLRSALALLGLSGVVAVGTTAGPASVLAMDLRADPPVVTENPSLDDADGADGAEQRLAALVATVQGTIEGALAEHGPKGPPPGTDPDDGETETTTDPSEPESAPEAAPAEPPAETEPAAADGGAEEEPVAGEPVPDAAFFLHLERTRNLATESVPEVINVDLIAATNLPFLDYTDVPLGPRSSREIIDILTEAGASDATIAEIMTPFPVAGPASYSNDWGAARHTPAYHAHEGTDLFAPRGTPVVASIDGTVTTARDTAIGGNSVTLTGRDGTYLYYAHLDDIAPAAVNGASVRPGTVIGYVGSTGNAAGGVPHLHFEVHPGGADPIPPLPYLDRWLLDARERALEYLDANGYPAVAPGPFAAAVPRPAIDVFQPAASTEESGLDRLTGLLVIAVPFLLYRKRNTLRALLPPIARASAVGRLATRRRPVDAGTPSMAGASSTPRDVLAPFLTRGQPAPAVSSETHDLDAEVAA